MHRYYHSPVGLPSCVTPSLAYYQSGSRARPDSPTSGLAGFGRSASLGPAWAFLRGYGNINPLSIDYACRPRLRSRLTLGGIPCPRKPWAYGERDSHPFNRYSSLHIHFLALQRTLPYAFSAARNALLRLACASPRLRFSAYSRSLSAPDSSTSELLRTL